MGPAIVLLLFRIITTIQIWANSAPLQAQGGRSPPGEVIPSGAEHRYDRVSPASHSDTLFFARVVSFDGPGRLANWNVSSKRRR